MRVLCNLTYSGPVDRVWTVLCARAMTFLCRLPKGSKEKATQWTSFLTPYLELVSRYAANSTGITHDVPRHISLPSISLHKPWREHE